MPAGDVPAGPAPTCQSPGAGGSAPLLAAARQPPCETPHPCDWGFGVGDVTGWMQGRHRLTRAARSSGSSAGPEWAASRASSSPRVLSGASSFGDLVWIIEVPDSAALRAHLAGLERAPVGDEGWIEVMSDAALPDLDVYFRVGETFVMAALWTGRTDRGDALAFASAVAAIVPRG